MLSSIKKLIAIAVSMVVMMGVVQAELLKHKIQDSKKAAHYFEDELNFKITPHTVEKMIEGTVKNFTIVDVRDAKSYAEGHVPGAINLPFDKYNNFEGPVVEYPGLRKDGYNYIYCYELLCNLGQKASKQFAIAGYPVKEMVGGFAAWKERGFPIEK